MEKKPLNKKIIIILSIVIVAVIAAVIAFMFFMKKKDDSYRSIQIYDLEGEATITRDAVGTIAAAENLFLQSGDSIEVPESSSMRLKLDDDKYIMIEESSKLRIEASGTSENSKTKIILEAGAITNEIQNKLNEESTYEVETPNSVMAVRGTTFRVEILSIEDGMIYVKASTFDGAVATKLIMPDGTVQDEEVIIEAGKEIVIEKSAETTKYVVPEPQEIDYRALQVKTLENLKEIVDSGKQLSVSAEILEEIIAEKKEVEARTGTKAKAVFEITFTYQGSIFATQEVEQGNRVVKPTLVPASNGDWNYDFSTKVYMNMEIPWN